MQNISQSGFLKLHLFLWEKFPPHLSCSWVWRSSYVSVFLCVSCSFYDLLCLSMCHLLGCTLSPLSQPKLQRLFFGGRSFHHISHAHGYGALLMSVSFSVSPALFVTCSVCLCFICWDAHCLHFHNQSCSADDLPIPVGYPCCYPSAARSPEFVDVWLGNSLGVVGPWWVREGFGLKIVASSLFGLGMFWRPH